MKTDKLERFFIVREDQVESASTPYTAIRKPSESFPVAIDDSTRAVESST